MFVLAAATGWLGIISQDSQAVVVAAEAVFIAIIVVTVVFGFASPKKGLAEVVVGLIMGLAILWAFSNIPALETDTGNTVSTGAMSVPYTPVPVVSAYRVVVH